MGTVWDTLAPRNLELGPLAEAERDGATSPWRNWRLAHDEDCIAWLALDKAGASANTLAVDVLSELDKVLASLEKNVPKGLVLRSAKPSGFIAGADIGEFRGLTDAAMVEERLSEAHAVVDRLDRLGAPTVAVIHGYCLGGGLEIALACDYRIAVEDARLGFPEVMLGLHPGLGGTVRLPRLINPLEAMTMMLTGRNVRAARARSLGLVDAVVPERHVKAAAIAAVAESLKLQRSRVLVPLINSHYARVLAAKRMRRETEGKAAIARAADLFKKIGHRSIDTRDALDRLTPDLDGAGVRSADLIIEAVPETLELKRKVYAATQTKMKPDALLATNTSSIPLQELRFGLRRPDHFVGLHFFNPVSRMQLVEVVSHDEVAPDALTKARAFVGRIDRLPAPVKSAPGFLVNRALTPYMLEALLMLNEGYKRETIDAAAESFGMPMGPIELADTVGLDICLDVAETLKGALERPMPDVSQALRGKVELGHLGRKSGRGFYEWRYGKAVKDRDAPKPTEEMTDRLILPMLDVTVACLREGVVADEDTVDAAMIFATGFAPFRGGPMHYARTRRAGNIRAELERLAQRYGERFRPDTGWDRLT